MKFRTVIAILAALCLLLVAGACAKDKKATMLACIKEMTDFWKSDAVKDMFVNGQPDQAKLEAKMEEIAKKHYKDKGEFETGSKELEADPEIKKAGEDMMAAMMEAMKKYGSMPAMPTEMPTETPAVTEAATPADQPAPPAQ